MEINKMNNKSNSPSIPDIFSLTSKHIFFDDFDYPTYQDDSIPIPIPLHHKWNSHAIVDEIGNSAQIEILDGYPNGVIGLQLNTGSKPVYLQHGSPKNFYMCGMENLILQVKIKCSNIEGGNLQAIGFTDGETPIYPYTSFGMFFGCEAYQYNYNFVIRFGMTVTIYDTLIPLDNCFHEFRMETITDNTNPSNTVIKIYHYNIITGLWDYLHTFGYPLIPIGFPFRPTIFYTNFDQLPMGERFLVDYIYIEEDRNHCGVPLPT